VKMTQGGNPTSQLRRIGYHILVRQS
jgi:hypothetical protein